jgi:kinesin family protein 3/17
MATSFQELEKALKDGNKHKSTGETLMNRDSSRSHCIFTIYIETSEIMKVSTIKL